MTVVSRWSMDHYVRRPGRKRFEFPMMPQFGLTYRDKDVASVEPYWIVEATFGDDAYASGSCSFGHCRSYEEAQEQMAEMQKLPRNSKYTDWVIVEYTPMILGRVVHREPVRET